MTGKLLRGDARPPRLPASVVHIVGVRFSRDRASHPCVTLLRTVEADGLGAATWRRSALVKWIRAGGRAFVYEPDAGADIPVRVVDDVLPLVRAFDGASATDSLLKLPRF